MTNDTDRSERGRIMDAIRKGKVHMKPRWQFVLLSIFAVTGALLVFLTLVYIASLGVFFLRDSGALFAPSFGGMGWWVLLHSLPWLLIILLIIFVVVLEWLVRQYAFVYKKPLIVSLIGIVAVIFVGGFLISQTPFHRTLMLSARRGLLPPALMFIYRGPLEAPPPGDVYRGEILSTGHNGFLMMDEGGAGTTSVILTPQTRLPYGEDFSPGERVLVVGDMASGSVEAFGVREIDEYAPPPSPAQGP